MAFIPTAGAVRVDIEFVLAQQQVHNIIWCSRDAAWTQAEREGLADAIKTWWDTGAKVAFSSQIALTRITVVNQDTANAPSSTLVVSPPIAGGGGAVSAPNNAACVATLRTDLRGRNYRGRMYFGGIPTGSITDSITLLLAFTTSLITQLGNLKTAIEALGAIWVVVSKFVNKLPRASGLKTPVSAITVDQYIDSQRRRLGGRGV